ncbi:unnamed protein product, partial [marine sediment metagenome]
EHFTKIIQKDRKIHNAYLLIHSEKLGIQLNMVEGSTFYCQCQGDGSIDNITPKV